MSKLGTSKLSNCQIEGCNNLARYGLFKTSVDGKKSWLYVCLYHEGIIGSENMHQAGGRYEGGSDGTREG